MGLVEYSSSDDDRSDSETEKGAQQASALVPTRASAANAHGPRPSAHPPSTSGLPDADALFNGSELPAAASRYAPKRPLQQAAKTPAALAQPTKVPKTQSGATASIGRSAAAGCPAMLPPQLGGRKNVPTEDMKRLFTQGKRQP